MRIKQIGAVALAFGGLAMSPAPSSAEAVRAAEDCKALSSLTLEGTDLKIEKAEHVEGETPHCLVTGSFEHRKGAEDVDYALGFGIALPDQWSGRFLFQGGGGLNGTVRPPLGEAAAGDTSALARGFAVISTDSGHKSETNFDPSFKKDQMSVINFAQGSVDKVTQVGKRIVEDYYGQAPDHSYFVGCSTGGREGMSAAQRYPGLFDGIIAGAPAMRTDRSNMSLARKAVALNAIVPDAADGTPDRAAAFSPEQRELVLAGILEACDGLDGVEDGMIFNAKQCTFDPAKLVCAAGQNDKCLSTEQADFLKSAFAPTMNAGGQVNYPAFPADTGVVSDTDPIPGLLRFDDKRNRQFRNVARSFDVDAETAKVDADPHQRLINTDQWKDLGSFAGQGSKMIFYHGMSDPWFSANDTIDYYEKMTKVTSARVPADDWSRLYLVPGMAHCRGGPAALDQFDMLSALVEWVEDDKAPAAITATGQAFPDRQRPLCAYPAHAQYKGSGAENDVASFECRQ